VADFNPHTAVRLGQGGSPAGIAKRDLHDFLPHSIAQHQRKHVSLSQHRRNVVIPSHLPHQRRQGGPVQPERGHHRRFNNQQHRIALGHASGLSKPPHPRFALSNSREPERFPWGLPRRTESNDMRLHGVHFTTIIFHRWNTRAAWRSEARPPPDQSIPLAASHLPNSPPVRGRWL